MINLLGVVILFQIEPQSFHINQPHSDLLKYETNPLCLSFFNNCNILWLINLQFLFLLDKTNFIVSYYDFSCKVVYLSQSIYGKFPWWLIHHLLIIFCILPVNMSLETSAPSEISGTFSFISVRTMFFSIKIDR